MSCRTSCCKKLSFVFALLALAVLTAPAFGQTCMQDEFDAFNATPGVTLNCTANDVSVAKVTGFNIISGGVGNKCLENAPFTFVADFEILTTSNKTRSNIGLFFGTGTGASQNGALTGSCSDAILSPTYTCPGTGGMGQPAAVTCGDFNYEELDQAINGEPGTGSPIGCGDTSSTDNGGFGPGTQAAEIEVGPITCPLPANTVPCPAGSGFTGSCLPLPECTSWWQPTSTMPKCESPAPTYPWQPQAVPGTKSKCSCTTLFIPVQPISPSVTVAKGCDLGSDTTPHPSCTFVSPNLEGGNVVYTVTITNTTPTGEGGVVIDQICDDRYGQIFPSSGTCAPGSIAAAPSSTTCSTSMPGTILNGSSGFCTFTVNHGENLSVTDTVTVTGHSALSSAATFGPTPSGSVTVTSSDAPSTATTNEGLAPGPHHACVTLTYTATVTNNSGADEILTLNSVVSPYTPALRDSHFGDITTTHGTASQDASVTGTTCGTAVSSVGAGSLSDRTVVSGTTPPPLAVLTATQAYGGSFPATLATSGGSYTCEFDGVVCGIPTQIGNCAEALQVPNTTLTAHLTGDDTSPAPADSITVTETPFTANVCLVQSGQ